MAETKAIRIIIADHHALVRAGLNAYLHAHKHIQLLGEAENAEDTLQLCEMLNPDLVLLDAQLPGTDGIAAARMIHDRWPVISILMLLGEPDPALIQASLAAGAAGALTKNISPQELLEAIQTAQAHLPVAVNKSQGAESIAAGGAGKGTSGKRTTLELEAAGRIQSQILPEKPPALEDWDISAVLEPAYETSGDFYDFIPLPYGKTGIVIGDVANKGLGAAIFMAMCNSLIRTYATHFPIMPGMMVNAVNERLNADTRSGMFVTIFYGVLDPKLSRLIYVNAGHNPPILISDNKGKPVDQLSPTGPALGIFEQSTWQQKMAKFSPGDVLVLYTDGVTEAQNPQGDFYDEPRLQNIIRGNKDKPARKIQQAILNSVKRFTQNAPQDDDIALIVMRRES